MRILGAGRMAVACARVAVVAGVAIVLLAGFAGSAGAASGVVWDLRTTADSTVAPGGSLRFNVHLTNVGDRATDGSTVTMRATLPPGFRLASATAIHPSWDCSGAVVGASSVVCTTSSVVAARPVGPEPFPFVMITVDVDGDAAPGLHTVQFSLDGGDPDAVGANSPDPTVVSGVVPGFEIEAFDGGVFDAAGNAFTAAGGHPFSISTQIDFTRGTDPVHGPLWPSEPAKNIVVDLPPGLIGDPSVTGAAKCTTTELGHNIGPVQEAPECPDGSQVGVAIVGVQYGLSDADNQLGPVSVYNMVPPPDAPARFGFNVAGSVVILDARVRASDYGVSIDVSQAPQALPIIGTQVTLWGNPADPVHDPQRSCSGRHLPSAGGPTCRSTGPDVAFLRNPTTCSAPAGSPVQDGLVTSVHADSWFNPGARLADGSPDLSDPNWKSASFVSHLTPGYPADPDDPSTPWGPHQLPTGCENVPFNPSLEAGPSGLGAVSTPSGFAFDVGLEQNENPDGIAESDLRKAVVTLPAGVRVSPSSAQGLAGCSPAQIGLRTNSAPSCPEGSRIGTVSIRTPLLEEPLEGAVYLASPRDNPFGTLIAVYLVAEGQGLTIKLAGRVDADPDSGQLISTFDDNPQTPFSNLHLQFKDGPRAPLVTPDMCGTYTTSSELTSWSGRTVTRLSTFTVSSDGHGAPCVARGFDPAFTGGTVNPVAGRRTPLLVSFSRGDRDQQLAGVSVEVPDGVLGKVKNVSLCEAVDAINGTCGEASRIGSVTVGAGAGATPFYITNGRAYFTGPYKGAPFGLSIVVPAVAGPFNLGNVNVRAAVFVDRASARLKVVSDPLPRILEGIPLDVRDVRVRIDREDFIVNPTSCKAKQALAAIESTGGVTATRSTRFQVGGCSDLELAPKVTLSVGARGRTRFGASTPFSTVIRQSAGQSNLKSVSVTLPRTLNARLPVVQNACTMAQFQANDCEKARAGTAVARTPLLKDPLKGGVYFVKNGRPLPDLIMALRGQVDLDIAGKVTIPGGSRLATSFDAIPDAAITEFRLDLVAGKRGPLGTAANLCTRKARRATARLIIKGQNGDTIRTNKHLLIRGCTRAKTNAKKHNKTNRGR